MSLSLLLAAGVAHAGAAGWYDPMDAASRSAQFQRAQDVAGVTFGERQSRADALAAALIAYEVGLDLLGDTAPTDQRTRHQDLLRTFLREQAVLRDFAQGQLDGFDAAFRAATERATRSTGWEPCAPTRPSLRVGPGFTRGPEVACEGVDHTADVAARLDADAVLARDLDTLLSATWPSLSLSPTAVAPVHGGGGHLDVLALVDAIVGDALDDITQADDDARESFAAALEEGADEDAHKALLAEARALTARTAAARAAAAAPVLAALDASRKKLPKVGVAADVGLCAQPVLLGGCAGDAVSAAKLADVAALPKLAALSP